MTSPWFWRGRDNKRIQKIITTKDTKYHGGFVSLISFVDLRVLRGYCSFSFQIFFFFHFPCRNKIALAAAIADSAIAIDANTPFDFIPTGFASA